MRKKKRFIVILAILAVAGVFFAKHYVQSKECRHPSVLGESPGQGDGLFFIGKALPHESVKMPS